MSDPPPDAGVTVFGRFGSSAATHVGTVRKRNEDAFASCPEIGLWAVADGVGGYQAGDVASHTVTEALRTIPPGLRASELLALVRLRVVEAHARLREQAARLGPGATMATTIVVLLAREGHFACLWAGDSRAYLLRDGRIAQVTNDHSLVQELVDAHAITPQEAAVHPRANVITRAVGAGDDELSLDKVSDRLLAGDRFLLCSDGLWKMLGEDELVELMTGGGEAPAARLLAAALDRHADDNVTVVTVEVGPDPGSGRSRPEGNGG